MGERVPVIVVLDDFDQARFVVRAVLERDGYSVLEAKNGTEAVDIFERSGDTIDLLISDVLLAGAYGTEIAKHISALRPQMPILFISGYPMEELVNQGLMESDESSAKIAFLRKPFDPGELLGKVRDLISAPKSRGSSGG